MEFDPIYLHTGESPSATAAAVEEQGGTIVMPKATIPTVGTLIKFLDPEVAHSDPAVQEMWKAFGEACEYRKLRDLAEASDLFASFIPVDL